MSLEIRDAAAPDARGWRTLWHDYLAFYKVTLAPEVTDAVWARALDPDSRLGLRLAFEGGQMVGFATHHWHLSTWALGPDGYLEDLFVTPGARGCGVGRALIEDLRRLGAERGWARLYWMTDAGNARARALYDSITPSDGHLRYRLTL